MKGHFNFMAGAKKALAVVIALGMSATAMQTTTSSASAWKASNS